MYIYFIFILGVCIEYAEAGFHFLMSFFFFLKSHLKKTISSFQNNYIQCGNLLSHLIQGILHLLHINVIIFSQVPLGRLDYIIPQTFNKNKVELKYKMAYPRQRWIDFMFGTTTFFSFFTRISKSEKLSSRIQEF